jgi:sporadic carbohydrate cluster protein (TIGR04323 family)
MTIASITTDINIGPFKIPSNGQNMIMNNYAQRNSLAIELVIPEPIISNELATTQWLHNSLKFTKIILCSIYQLPRQNDKIKKIIANMSDVEFHFSLEGISGQGEQFIRTCAKEVEVFYKIKLLDSSKINWLEMHQKLKNEIFE